MDADGRIERAMHGWEDGGDGGDGDDGDDGWEDASGPVASTRDECLRIRFERHVHTHSPYCRQWLLTHFSLVLWALRRNTFQAATLPRDVVAVQMCTLGRDGTDPAIWWRWAPAAGKRPARWWRAYGWPHVVPLGWLARRRTRRFRLLRRILRRASRGLPPFATSPAARGRAASSGVRFDAVDDAVTAAEIAAEGPLALWAEEAADTY